MRHILLGSVSSDREMHAVTGHAERQWEQHRNSSLARQLMDLLNIVVGIERRGIASERKRLIGVEGERGVWVYVGNSAPRFDEAAIWAAIEVRDEFVVTLLKVVHVFSGSGRQHAELLGDAVDRMRRGTRI